jgi:uncharacterized protein YndB with AHSA1/START domain
MNRTASTGQLGMAMPPFATTTLRLESRMRSSTKQVFAVWTEASRLRRVFQTAALDDETIELEFKPKVSAPLRLTVRRGSEERRFTGEVVEFDAPRQISFTWVAHEASKETTLVAVGVLPAKSVWGGTDVLLTHERVLIADAETTRAWWTRVLGAVSTVASQMR